jgi:hypothetical protein
MINRQATPDELAKQILELSRNQTVLPITKAPVDSLGQMQNIMQTPRTYRETHALGHTHEDPDVKKHKKMESKSRATNRKIAGKKRRKAHGSHNR